VQKVVYVVWRPAALPPREFNALLQSDVAPKLLAAGARGLTLNLQDEAVRDAERVRQVCTRPQMEALAQVWMDSAIERFRKGFDDALLGAGLRIAAYLVQESVPIVNQRHPPVAGRRTAGFAQIAFFARPPRLTYDGWLEIWQRDHTGVAIDTQANFYYAQNVVTRPLTYAAPPIDAMVEECFPAAAMADPMAFFAAAGDKARYEKHLKIMMESCVRFIDFDKIDVIPTSQYVVKPLQAVRPE
jgi:hypothetical protein